MNQSKVQKITILVVVAAVVVVVVVVVVALVVAIGQHGIFSVLVLSVAILVQPASPTAWLTTHLIPGSTCVDVSMVFSRANCSMYVLDQVKLTPRSPAADSRSFPAPNPAEIFAFTLTVEVVEVLVVIEDFTVYCTVSFVLPLLQ